MPSVDCVESRHLANIDPCPSQRSAVWLWSDTNTSFRGQVWTLDRTWPWKDVLGCLCMRSHNGGFTRAFMEVLVVDDHTGSDAWVVHSVAVGVRGTSSSFSLSPRLVRGVGSLGLPQHTDAVWLNTQLQTRTWYNRDQHTKIHSLLYIFFLLGVAECIMCL